MIDPRGRQKALLVFIDGTICDTRHRHGLTGTPAFHAPEHLAQDRPVDGSVEALREAARGYTIVYLGARPPAAIPATEAWLAKAGFPQGLVQAASTQRERLDIVRHLGRRFEFVAGIGARWDDNELHLELGCLSIILKEFEGNWEAVRRFLPVSDEQNTPPQEIGRAGTSSPNYRATLEPPPLVQEAKALTRRMRFQLSSADDVGRLLHVLAGSVKSGTVGEIGTGCGEGSAWMISALASGVRYVTVDLQHERVEACRAMFAGYPAAQVLEGDWHQILRYGPFELLFPDGGGAKQEEPETVLSALAPGGLAVLDDLTPERLRLPGEEPDPVREFFLNDPRVAATEILVTPTHAVIVARRVS